MKLPLAVLVLLAVVTGCARSSQAPVQSEDSSNIIGGEFVNRRDSAASRSLVHLKIMKGASVVSGCSATLIDQETVLTAAHCLDGDRPFDAVYVEFSLRPLSDKNLKVGVMTGFALHPQYNTGTYETYENVLKNNKWQKVPKSVKGVSYDHDLAVLVFKGSLPSDQAPIEIDRDDRKSYANERIQVYGYGMSSDWDAKGPEVAVLNGRRSDLRRGEFKVVSDFDKNSDHYNTVSDSNSKTWTCQGDSGGPQFYIERGVTKLIGVNSTSNGPVIRRFKDFKGVERAVMSCKGSGKAIRVAAFADWILKARQKLMSDSKTDPRLRR